MRRLIPTPCVDIVMGADGYPASAHHDDLLAECYAWSEDAYVRLSMIASLDGRCTIDGRSSRLGGVADQQVLHLQRDLAEVVLVGAKTVLSEGYRWEQLSPARRERRRRFGLSEQLPLAVIASRPLPKEAEVTAGDGPVRVHIGSAATAVAALRDQGYRRILCEGGPRVAAALLADGLVDEWALTVAPRFVGQTELPLLPGPGLPAAFHLRSLLTADDFLFLRYTRTQP